MKRLCIILAALALLLPALALSAAATSVEEALRLQEEGLDLDELERAARQGGVEVEYGVTLDEGLRSLLDTGSEAAGGIIKGAVRSGVLLMVILLLCGFAQTVYETAGKGSVPAIPLVGVLAITAVAAADVNAMLGLGRTTIQQMTSFSNVLFPVVTAVTAATGAVTGAAVRQMAAALFSGVLVNLINGLLVPLLYGYLAASVACTALENDGLKRIAALLKWVVTTLLAVVMLAFVGYLTVSGVVAGTTDKAAIKAAKFAISGAIPVVGGIMSDAAETILASAGLLKGTVGVFGAITILGVCLLPLLKIAVHYLMYKLVSAVSAAVGPGRVCALVDQLGSAFGLMLGMTGACCLLLLVTLVSCVMAVGA